MKTKATSPKPQNIGIYLSQNPEAIAEARGAINDILSCATADQATKVVALNVLGQLCNINHATITNCSVSQQPL